MPSTAGKPTSSSDFSKKVEVPLFLEAQTRLFAGVSFRKASYLVGEPFGH